MDRRPAEPGTGDDGIERVSALIREPDSETAVLGALDHHARTIVANDVVHRLLPFADQLSTYRYDGRPWAALVAGAALCEHDRRLGRALVAQARAAFVAAGEHDGEGLSWFVEGLEELSEGRTASAAGCWAKARPLIGDVSAVRMIGAHEALTAFVEGDVQRSIVLAEQALWASQQRGDRRAEAIGHLVLGLAHLLTGRFSVVEHSIGLGLAVLGELPETDRYELPMFLLQRATMLGFRCDPDSESFFQASITAAQAQHNSWYESIARAVRAERTAHLDPVRAVTDARMALDYFVAVDETWWSRTARLAFGRAHLQLGNEHAVSAICEELAADDLTGFDRGRLLLLTADLTAPRDHAATVEHLHQAVWHFASIGASFWEARAELKLAVIDTRRGEYHRRRAAARVPARESADAAWQRVLLGDGVLTVHLLGDRTVEVDGRRARFVTRYELELIAMLAVQPHGVDRSVIADRLWPAEDDQRVQHRIDNLLSATRRALAPTIRIVTSNGRVVMKILPGECDVRDVMDSAIRELRSPSMSPTERSELANRLESQLLDDLAAPWVVAEQAHLDDLAARLRRQTDRVSS